MLCTHVDDLLFAHKPSGAKVIQEILGKFSVGKTEEGSFRYCGRRFTQHDDFTIEIDAEENTRGIKPILIDKSRKGTDVVTEKELTSLRSVTGSLAWVARYCRADLAYKVNELQRLCTPKATVSDLRLANKAVELAHQNQNMKLVYKANWIDWKILQWWRTATRHLPTSLDSNPSKAEFTICLPLRVCRKRTIASMWSGSLPQHWSECAEPHCKLSRTRFRGAVEHVTAWGVSCVRWQASWPRWQTGMNNVRWNETRLGVWLHELSRTPECRSAQKVQDMRLGIELAALRQSLWTGNGQKSSLEYSPYGDELWWIETARMLADALTKSMKPCLLTRTLTSGLNSLRLAWDVWQMPSAGIARWDL